MFKNIKYLKHYIVLAMVGSILLTTLLGYYEHEKTKSDLHQTKTLLEKHWEYQGLMVGVYGLHSILKNLIEQNPHRKLSDIQIDHRKKIMILDHIHHRDLIPFFATKENLSISDYDITLSVSYTYKMIIKLFIISLFISSALILIFGLWMKTYKQRVLVQEKQEELEILEELAHDIRSPVVGLKVLSHQLNFESEYEQKLFQTSTDRIGKIAQTLLDHTKKRNTSKNSHEEILVGDLLETLVEEKRLILKSKFPETSGEVKIDFDPKLKIEKKKLEDYARVLGNLVDNSLDALVPSGKHEVQVLIRKKDPLFFKKIQRSRLVTEVNDTGRGIDQKNQSRLFQKGASFEKKNGNGLGLYSAKKWVQKNRGKIKLESAIDVGTRVKFEIEI